MGTEKGLTNACCFYCIFKVENRNLICKLLSRCKLEEPGANLPICSTDIPDIPTFFISQENILGYEYYHKTHGDNKTTH